MKHTYITKRDTPLCDFCGSDRVQYRYPCAKKFEQSLSATDEEETLAMVTGDWMACAKCTKVVDTKDPRKLAASVIRRSNHLHGVPQGSRAMIRTRLCKVLRDFYTPILPALGEKEENCELRLGEGESFRITGDSWDDITEK